MTKLVDAHVAYNTPKTAHVGHQVVIQAKLSSIVKPDALGKMIDEPGTVADKPLLASERMIATLFGGTAFDITPSGPQQQLVAGDVTEWDWQVTPKSAGEQTLLLRIDAVLTVDGKDNTRTVNTLKAKIKVDVGWPDTLAEWFELLKSTTENASWLWASLLLPIGGFIYHIFRPKAPDEPNAEIRTGRGGGANGE